MICSYCATELPAGAMFCGECGRPVKAEAAADATSATTSAPTSATTSAPTTRIPIPAVAVDRCAQCGAVLEPGEIFCGECGFVRQGGAQRARDTVLLDPFPWGSAAGVQPEVAERDSAEPDSAQPDSAEPEQAEPVIHERVIHEQIIHEQIIHEPVIHAPVIHEPVGRGAEVRHEPAASGGDSAQAMSEHPELVEPDIGETRIVDRSRHGERFVLQFSTGESVSVTGSGLLGRNPLPEPGEYFDSIVVITDPGRSVSKTHLEFGQDGGVFWVSDRYSGNGTIVREPETQPRRCDAGKRYRVVRGTRVDIGEQFFIVS